MDFDFDINTELWRVKEDSRLLVELHSRGNKRTVRALLSDLIERLDRIDRKLIEAENEGEPQ